VLFVNVDPLDAVNDSDAASRLVGWVALAASVAVASLAIRFAYMVAAGFYDAFVTTTVEGEILRERTRGSDENVVHWVAVDTGKLPKVHAWRVTPERAAEVSQHQVVRATVTPLLGFVRSFEVLPVVSK
jgi:hypothetical protein